MGTRKRSEPQVRDGIVGQPHGVVCCRIYLSSRLARTATAKGGGEQLKTGTHNISLYYVLGVIFIGPALHHLM